jgi:hypothetical protein
VEEGAEGEARVWESGGAPRHSSLPGKEKEQLLDTGRSAVWVGRYPGRSPWFRLYVRSSQKSDPEERPKSGSALRSSVGRKGPLDLWHRQRLGPCRSSEAALPRVVDRVPPSALPRRARWIMPPEERGSVLGRAGLCC